MGRAAPASSKGQSLWKDAWKRLRKNKFAMGGLVVVVLVSLTAIFASALTSYEADYGQPWIRAQPPGFEHPAVLAEIRYDKGKEASVPKDVPDLCAEIMTEDGVLEYKVQEVKETIYRVKLRRGKVDQIKKVEGARTVRTLEIKGDQQYVQPLDAPDGVKVRNVILKVRKPLPEGLASKGKILMLRVVETKVKSQEHVRVEIRDGVVVSIQRAGADLEQLRIEGRYVSETKKDGEVQTLSHPLGTDLAGRDVLSRVIFGGQISLMVGAIATIVSVLIGVIYGALAGYLAHSKMTAFHFIVLVVSIGIAVFAAVKAFDAAVSLLGGEGTYKEQVADAGAFPAIVVVLTVILVLGAIPAVSSKLLGAGPGLLGRRVTTKGEFMMRVVDILNALPFMFLVILLMVSFGRDILTLFLALGAVQWLTIARIVRGQVLSLKEKEFVEAARMCGTSHKGIIFSHLIPNTLGVVIVYATLTVPAVILQESFLAFIGLTVELQGRALDSWGSLVNIGRQALTSDGGNWWVLIFPSLAMAITLFSLNFLGDGLRDALDPKLKGKS